MFQTLRKLVRFIVSDPRHYQILCLACLLTIGVTRLHLDIRPLNAMVSIVTALTTQYAFYRLLRLPSFDPRSPFISSLSLTLLLRTSSPWIAATAVFIAIASKYVIRSRGKHIFNPTNIGIVAAILLFDNAWVSSGQWGAATWTVFLLACLGGLVVNRAGRSDISLGVIMCYAALLFGRALWLGDPMSIPIHQMQNGALLIFAFFMISDPKTTPNSRAGRFTFAALIVAFAGWVQFGLFEPNGLLYALAALAPAVPIIDRLMPGERFEWNKLGVVHVPKQKGARDEKETHPYPVGMHLPEPAGR